MTKIQGIKLKQGAEQHNHPHYQAFIQEREGRFNFDQLIHVKPNEFVAHIGSQGGYYVMDGEESLVFIPWDRIDFFRFSEVAAAEVPASEDQLSSGQAA